MTQFLKQIFGMKITISPFNKSVDNLSKNKREVKMSRKLLDLSVSLEEGIKSDPDFMFLK